ncbi:AMIN domain-containing protein [Fundidesulfovibrio soli]|uniref:AMIN domain-containing protein n=1 Tax=Fundidesulfovibrio soli TaxID=2922716 RepID=UPI001FAFE01A|nr:AMIN domain-containing protein [Fundidesulfovibrio soli]
MAVNNAAKVVVAIVIGVAVALGAGIAYMNRQEAPEPKPAQQAKAPETPPPSPAQPQPEPAKQAPKAENVPDPYAASGDPHKVTTDSEAARVAKLGRSVPMEAQQGEPAQAAPESSQAEDLPGLPAGLWTVRQAGGVNPAPAPAPAPVPAPEAATSAPAPAVQPAAAPEPAKPAKAQKPEKPAMPEKAQKPEKAAAAEKKDAPAKASAESKQASAPAPAKGEAGDAGAQATGKVLEVTAKAVSGALVLTVVTDAPVEKVLTARYNSPTRVVVDVVGHWQGGVKPSLASEADFVEKVRLGMHPDRLRIVFDYRDKQAAGGAEPKIEKQAKGVVITLPPSK